MVIPVKASRISLVDPASAEGEVAEIFARQVAQFGTVSNFYRTLAHAPAAIACWTTMNAGLRLRYVTEDLNFLQIEQMAIIKTSQLNGCDYCLGHNLELGRDAGLEPRQIAAVLGTVPDDDVLTPAQRCAVRWAEAVTLLTAEDDDELFTELRRHLSERQIVELTFLIGMWNCSNRVNRALRVELEAPECRLHFVRPAGSPTRTERGREG